MTNSSVWTLYQPLIVGLGAVVLATAGNTLLEWYRQRLQDRREARSIRVAIAEELRTHRRMYEGAWSLDDKADPTQSLFVPIDPFFPVYENIISRIGVLKPAQVGSILKAYSYLILAPKNFVLMGSIRKSEFASFAEIPPKYKPVLKNMYRDVVGVIDAALESLDD